MKKKIVLFFIIVITCMVLSCDGGTPPELYLSFFIDDWDTAVSSVDVDFTLTNGGEADLENCKIQLAVDTSDNEIRDYLATNTQWTDGVDLDKGETNTKSNFNITVVGTPYEVYVIASGFDNIDDSKMNQGSTIIYYNE